MTVLLHWVSTRLLRRTRIYQGTEMFGPVMPWREALRRATANVPNPRGHQ